AYRPGRGRVHGRGGLVLDVLEESHTCAARYFAVARWDFLLFWEHRDDRATLRAGGVVPLTVRVPPARPCRRAPLRGRGVDVQRGMASDLPDFDTLACLNRSWRIVDLHRAAQRAHGASCRRSSAAIVTVRV